MKFNQREQIAIKALRKVLDYLERGKALHITRAECTAINELLGIDLYEITHRKGEVDTFVKGKEDFHLVFLKPFSTNAPANKVNAFGYFNFQVKKLKVDEEKNSE